MLCFSADQRLNSRIPARFKKLVFVLVDAMRFDFINSPRYQKHMPFLEKLTLKGHRKLFKSMAKAPTVTLPRLKVKHFIFLEEVNLTNNLKNIKINFLTFFEVAPNILRL